MEMLETQLGFFLKSILLQSFLCILDICDIDIITCYKYANLMLSSVTLYTNAIRQFRKKMRMNTDMTCTV